ncbi:MAG: hypothetical protein K2P88_15875 [Chitinophagaceae bacterium]|uniref:hypothetical protein n=1 Tax=unclassified Paraflavitalea TaxID=2798305 RepID=UPI003D33A8A2|nr:hypothetical protein [Chitinophagaceae bacterium]
MLKRITFIISLVLLSAGVLNAQVLVKSFMDTDSIGIGTPVKVTIEGRLPLGIPYSIKIPDSIPHFEIIDKSELKEENEMDGKKFTQVITILSYDSGVQVIPPFEVQVKNKKYLTDKLSLLIGYMQQSETDAYRDIKAIVPAPPFKWTKELIALVVGSVLVLILILYLILRKKKQPKLEPQVPPKSPYEQAMDELRKLKQGWEREEVSARDFYGELNRIFRWYVQQTQEFSSLDKTNQEMIKFLKHSLLPKEQLELLIQTLRLSDFVKFAKYIPSKEEMEKSWFVTEISIKAYQNL